MHSWRLQLKDNEIIIAVARLDGMHTVQYRTIKIWAVFNSNNIRVQPFFYTNEQLAWQEFAKCKDVKYLTSRDAIVPVIEKHITNSNIEMKFNYALYDLLPVEAWSMNGMTYIMAVKATAKQLSIALLKAVGEWRE